MEIRPRPGNTFVGSPVERIEDRRFLRGAGQYVDDLEPQGMLHAAILRSPIAHGRIRVLDASPARALPGIAAVITAAEIGTVPRIPLRQDTGPTPALERFLQPAIAERKVRYVGEPVALVLAQSAALAEDALDAIRLEIDPLPPLVDRHESAKDQVLLFEEHGTNLMMVLTARKGDAARAFADAPYVRRERLRVQRHTAVPMEPRGLVASWDEAKGKLCVWGAAKLAFTNRGHLSRMIGLEPERIEMVENDVGGGFGVRGEFYPEDFLIPFAARATGRTVKWVEDRREHFIAANHARDLEAEIEIACRRDGTILALRGAIHADMGPYIRTNGVTASRNVAQILAGPYRVPNVDVDAHLHATSKTPVGTYRGPGRFEADFFRERLIDMAAKDLGIDRVEFRRRNLVADEEMPYPCATVMPWNAATEYDSGDYRATFERCLAEIGWAELAPLQGKAPDGRYHGLGVGCYVEGGASGPRENARLEVAADGTIAVYVGSSSVGQGVETVFAQIAADALEQPMSRIGGVYHGSTAHVSEGHGSHGSRATVMGGSAILAAAQTFKEALSEAAAKRLGVAPGAVEIGDGAVRAGGKALDFAALAGVSAEASFANTKRTYAYGAHAAHVAVDPRTGAVEILAYVAVEDVGRAINPLTLHGQSVGAIVQGLGGTFLEHLVYDEEGQLLTGTLADYLMPTASDFPRIKAIVLELKPSPNNPLGAKGAGEGGIIPVGGVIANAVASALASLGVEPKDLPLSPPRLWAMIEAAKAGRT